MNRRLFKFAWLTIAVIVGPILGTAQAATSDIPSSPKSRSWVRLDRYSGERGSAAISQGDFHQLVFELQNWRAATGHGTASAAQRQPYESLVAPRNNLRNKVPLCVLHWERRVEQPRTLASQSDGAEPVLTNVAIFAFSPLRPKTYRGEQVVLSLDTGDLFEECLIGSHDIASLRVDAGDGTGWHAMPPGGEVAVSYAATGAQTLQMEATLADGSVLSGSAPLEVVALATPDPTETLLLSKAKLYTYKSGAHAGYRSPVLVVEGFDLDNSMDWDALYAILNKEQLVESLLSYGRDLAVVDFNDATTNIYTNAENVMEAIRFLNTYRFNASDKFTVIGASMGGLVTRYALDRMEANPALYGSHAVDTWISFDSPQEGANIPLGIQEFFSFFGGFAGDYSDLAAALEYRKKIDTVAAQQMLLCHYKNTNTQAGRSPGYASFETQMHGYGYPANCKKVAITNGSKFGLRHAFSPGELIVYWNHESFSVDITSRIYALYNAPTPAKPVYYGWFNPWDFWGQVDYEATQNRYYPYSVDNASGGTRASFQELFDTLPSNMKDADDTCAYADHCFIPTTSALGLPNEYMELSLASNPSVLALTPFDEIHCAVTNESHIDINTSNKRWFMRAILENTDTDGDGSDDYREYLTGTDYTSSASKLSIVIGLSLASVSGSTTLSWATLPNVRYDIYQTASLDQEWALIDSVSSPAAATATRSYPMDAQKRSSFYKAVAEVVDPVTD